MVGSSLLEMCIFTVCSFVRIFDYMLVCFSNCLLGHAYTRRKNNDDSNNQDNNKRVIIRQPTKQTNKPASKQQKSTNKPAG